MRSCLFRVLLGGLVGTILAMLAMLAMLAVGVATATELWSSGEASVELTGSVREIIAGTQGTSERDFGRSFLLNQPACLLVLTFPNCPAWDELNGTGAVTSLTRLRLRLDARATPHLSAVLAYDQEILAGTLDTFEAQISGQFEASSLVDTRHSFVSTNSFQWSHNLYRAYLFFESEHVEVTLGRQRVPWGVGRLWNPIDRFNAIPPLSIEADQSQGVDALKARWLFSGFTYAEAIYAAGRTGRDRSYAARLHGVLHEVDYSLMAGVFEEAPTVGMDFAANLGEAAGRLEAVFTSPQRSVRPFGSPTSGRLPNYWQVVASVDNNFDVGSGLYVLVEHLYNGNALGFGRGKADGILGFFQEQDLTLGGTSARVVATGTGDLFGQSRVITQSRHLTGLETGYDVTPEIRASLLVIYDWDGGSASFFPRLSYSPFGSLEMTLGVQVFTGKHLSEYGGLRPVGFLLAEAFF